MDETATRRAPPGSTMAPATAGVMDAFPTALAGVGSAVNDTAREIGAAIGVAVFGSVAATVYRADLASAFARTPEAVAAAARSSVGGALRLASELGGAAGRSLAATATTAFTRGIGLAFAVTGALTLAAALTTAWAWRASVAGEPNGLELAA